MADATKTGKRTHVFAAIAALACVVSFAAFLPPAPVLPEPGVAPLSVKLFSAMRLSPQDAETMELYDFSPIFLSTKWNYGHLKLDLPSPSPEYLRPDSADMQSGMYAFREDLLDSHYNLIAERLLLKNYAYSSFGQEDADSKVGKLPAAAVAGMTVQPADKNDIVYSSSLELKSIRSGRFWAPVSMTVIVNDDEAPSAPLVVSGSGFELLDEEIENIVIKKLYGMNLRPGYYIISVFP